MPDVLMAIWLKIWSFLTHLDSLAVRTKRWHILSYLWLLLVFGIQHGRIECSFA